MPKTKICEICKRPKTNMICIDCVERDMRDWENKIFQKGKLEQKKEEIEWLNERIGFCNCFISHKNNDEKHKEIIRNDIKIFKIRIKQLQKEIGEEKGK